MIICYELYSQFQLHIAGSFFANILLPKIRNTNSKHIKAAQNTFVTQKLFVKSEIDICSQFHQHFMSSSKK
jgi:hypothetical protein